MRYPKLLLDPPWDFTTYSAKAQKSAKQHYPTMRPEELSALDVASLAETDAVAFVWATWPNLPECIEVGRAWGFEYKTAAFIWVKKTRNGKDFMGLGLTGTRANTEPCLLFTRGNGLERMDKSIRQIIRDTEQLSLFPQTIEAEIMAHSTKPYIQYELIDRLFAGRSIELFSRGGKNDWANLGNAIDGLPIDEAIKLEANR